MRYLKSGLEPMRERPGWMNAARMADFQQPNKTRDETAPTTNEAPAAFLYQCDCSLDGCRRVHGRFATAKS